MSSRLQEGFNIPVINILPFVFHLHQACESEGYYNTSFLVIYFLLCPGKWHLSHIKLFFCYCSVTKLAFAKDAAATYPVLNPNPNYGDIYFLSYIPLYCSKFSPAFIYL